VQATETKPIDDPFSNEVDDSEPLDEESQKALKNANTFNIDSLTKSSSANNKTDKPSNKKNSTKKPKANKGLDFLDYAKEKGINVNLQFDDSNKLEKKPVVKKENNYSSNNNNNRPSPNSGQNQFHKKGGKPKKFQKSYDNDNYFSNPPKLGTNKFDACNSGFMMGGMYPPQFAPQFSPQNFQPSTLNQDFQKLGFNEQDSKEPVSDKKLIDYVYLLT
jgi:hypothetical protein